MASSVPEMADDCDSQSHASTDVEVAVAQKAVQSSRNTSETPSVTSSYVNASSRNKRRQCSLCPFFGTHLQRHIAPKHPSTFTSKPEKIALVHHHDKLSRSQSGKKQVRQFQCTYKKCGAIVTRIGQHLLRVHKIQDQQQRADIQSRFIRLSNRHRQKLLELPVVSRPKDVASTPQGSNRAMMALSSLERAARKTKKLWTITSSK